MNITYYRQVSPPDKHGYCSLGTSVDCARSAVLSANHVIGLVNKHVPRTHGDGHVHISHFDTITMHDEKLPEIAAGGAIDEATAQIGKIIADNLIPDRGCLQLGIGGIPVCITYYLLLIIYPNPFLSFVYFRIFPNIDCFLYIFHLSFHCTPCIIYPSD